ncbi:inositol monophosphatase family protein, partial [Legionella sp. 29fVS95]|uniref:inositol monophosphatase family protein n=1 Tax=Legionella sp. 29fVS95 TaxID=3402813 RepID=UPI003AF586AF
EGRADLYFNFSGYCHLWDLCAPEIILQEAGGGVLLSSGKSIILLSVTGKDKQARLHKDEIIL